MWCGHDLGQGDDRRVGASRQRPPPSPSGPRRRQRRACAARHRAASARRVLVLQGGGALGRLPGRASTRRCTRPASSPTGSRHLDRRHQRQPDRRQRTRRPARPAARNSGAACEHDPLHRLFGACAGLGARGRQHAHGRARHPGLLPAEPDGVPGAARAARAGRGRLLRHGPLGATLTNSSTSTGSIAGRPG